MEDAAINVDFLHNSFSIYNLNDTYIAMDYERPFDFAESSMESTPLFIQESLNNSF